MKKNPVILLFCLLILTGLHFSQQGYVVAGSTESYTHGSGDDDFLIYKLDSNGLKQWRRNLGGIEDEEAYSIRQTSDGGYVVAGNSESYSYDSGDYDFLIYKLDSSGQKQWRKNLGGAGNDRARSIQQTADGGYVVAGGSYSYSYGSGDKDVLIYKLDSSGQKQWRKNLGGADNDDCYSIQQTADGGYVAVGTTDSYSHGSGDDDCLIYKLDANGSKQWRKNYGGSLDDWGRFVQQTSDGGYVIAGMTQSYTNGSGDRDFLLYKLDANGMKQWRKNYGGSLDDWGLCVQQTPDGGYVMIGYSYSYTTGTANSDLLIYKLDASGSKQWRKNLGGDRSDAGMAIRLTPDGGFVAAGHTSSYVHGSAAKDFLIYKLDASGRKQWRKNLGGESWDWAYDIRNTTN